MLAPLIALAAAAAPAPADLPGIWEGTVGTLPVRACFVHREFADFGAYYYLSHRRLIALEADEDSGTDFRESGDSGRGGPRWRIERADADRLTAQWTNGTRMLPVRLSRVARMEGDESPCSSPTFHRPRLTGVRTVTTRASLDGNPYSRLVLDDGGLFDAGFATFALDGDGAAVRRINSALASPLGGDPPSWFDCMRDSLGYSPREGYFDESLRPVLITSRWLSVAHHWDGYCGGAHPDSTNGYRTFDLTGGEEVDLHGWFNDTAVERQHLAEVNEDIVTMRPALRDFILRGWTPEDPECREVIAGQDYWSIGLTPRGMAFSPDLPHVVQACGEEFVLPFGRLGPFLTAEGAANLRTLEAELAARPRH
jgi:hypothetical protein